MWSEQGEVPGESSREKLSSAESLQSACMTGVKPEYCLSSDADWPDVARSNVCDESSESFLSSCWLSFCSEVARLPDITKYDNLFQADCMSAILHEYASNRPSIIESPVWIQARRAETLWREGKTRNFIRKERVRKAKRYTQSVFWWTKTAFEI